MRMRIVILNREILILKSENIFHGWIHFHLRKRAKVTRELEVHLLKVVGINMCIAKGVNELTQFQIADLRHHHGEQGIRSNVKRNAQENIRTALIELTA